MSRFQRSSGVLLPIFSLPSPHGIGTLGRAAHDFIDFLADAGQTYWQILPAGPAGMGNSPYSGLSSLAGNPDFIDLDLLVEDGLLTEAEVAAHDPDGASSYVDYDAVARYRAPLLRLAAERGLKRDGEALAAFRREQGWLADWSLYMAVREHYRRLAWPDWPDEDIRMHRPEACARWREVLRDEVAIYEYIQFIFFRQWAVMKAHAAERGIGIIGDMPIYVAMDSADVWAEPQWFQLDEKNVPVEVSGVPPDYFNEDGQLWGNPLYRWDALQRDGFGWWIRRVDGAFRLYDVLRIDHFRGLESFWAVPYGETTAKNGRWVKGPGMALVGVLKSWFAGKRFIAEDLGYMTPEVQALLADSGFPGMKVLEFAFDWREPSDYLPHAYPRNCVCFTGTHDNDTLAGWLAEADEKDAAHAKAYLGLNEEEGFVEGILRGGMSSVADLFIAQMQDWLGLGTEARTNIPGVPDGNWRWRMLPGAASPALAEKMRAMTKRYARMTAPDPAGG